MTANTLTRRHADRTVQLWLQRLKDSPSNKRLNLIYLANGKHDIVLYVATVHQSSQSLTVKFRGNAAIKGATQGRLPRCILSRHRGGCLYRLQGSAN